MEKEQGNRQASDRPTDVMYLPPLANLFAVYAADTDERLRIRHRVLNSDSRARVEEPAPGWLVALSPINSLPEAKRSHAPDTVFAEGPGPLDRAQTERLRELALRSPERLSELKGDWTFARFGAGGCATAVRSCGGRVPMYWWESSRTRGFATTLASTVRWRSEAPELDPLVNAMWLALYHGQPDDRTFLAGVKLLRRGYCVRFTPRTPARVQRYWDPMPETVPAPQGRVSLDVEQAFKRHLIDGLERELDPRGPNVATLSGGIDSSVLVSLAAKKLGRNVSTISIVPAYRPERDRELRYINAVAPPREGSTAFVLPHGLLTKMSLMRQSPPVAFHMTNSMLSLLATVNHRHNFSVLFGGEYADELCGSTRSRADWMRSVRASRLVHWREWPWGPRDPARWVGRRVRDFLGKPDLVYRSTLPSLVSEEIQAEYRDWFADYRQRAASDVRPLRGMHQFLERDQALAMHWEVASACGIRRFNPFMTRELIELAYAQHPDDLIGPGTKRLLRRALSSEVPALNLYRPDKGAFSGRPTPSLTWRTPIAPELESILGRDWFPTPPARVSAASAMSLWQLTHFADSVRTLRAEADQAAAPKSMARPTVASQSAVASG